MYDWPETRASLDRLWSAIATELDARGIPAPSKLHHQDSQMALWTNPGLVIGQTCGWPYANMIRAKVVPFARFDYKIDGVPAGHYRSAFIIAANSVRKPSLSQFNTWAAPNCNRGSI